MAPLSTAPAGLPGGGTTLDRAGEAMDISEAYARGMYTLPVECYCADLPGA